MYIAEEVFIMNRALNSSKVFNGIWQIFKSVVFEELVTRGVLLYILIKRLGKKWAIFISSLFFSLLHLNILPNDAGLIEMVLTFLYPFMFGLVMAYSYVKSYSLYFPFAIHFGWNIIENLVAPGKSNDSILIIQEQPIITVSYFAFFMVVAFPKLLAITVDYFIVKKIPLNASP